APVHPSAMAAGAVQRGLDRLAIDSVAVAVAMARDAPAHRELLDLNGPVERLHLAVTALTLDARPGVCSMIKVGQVGKSSHADPARWRRRARGIGSEVIVESLQAIQMPH